MDIIIVYKIRPQIEISIDTSEWADIGIYKGNLHTNFYLPNNELCLVFMEIEPLLTSSSSWLTSKT